MVECHQISAKDLFRLHQFGSKVLPGIFLGYALHGGRIWKGDILVADIEELEEMDASEIHAKRLNAKEVLTPMNGEIFIFPIADGTVKLSGGDQVLRTTTLIKDRLDRGEEQGYFLLQHHLKTHRGMMVKQEMIAGPSQAILFTVITWNPESNCTCRKKNHSQFHYDFFNVTRIASTTLDENAALTIIGMSKRTEIYQMRPERVYMVQGVWQENEYCDVSVNRSDDNILTDYFQVSQRLTSDPTTTPQQCTKEIDKSANRADLTISETWP